VKNDQLSSGNKIRQVVRITVVRNSLFIRRKLTREIKGIFIMYIYIMMVVWKKKDESTIDMTRH
jgi:hypothetical protein